MEGPIARRSDAGFGIMRELSPWAIRSGRRDAWRAFYEGYMKSPEWFRRREAWAREECARLRSDTLWCAGGCGTEWTVRRGDLHHNTYVRLGDEAHEDLWALCRGCHDRLHELIESSRSWRRLPRELANHHALAVVRAERTGSVSTRRVRSLRDYL